MRLKKIIYTLCASLLFGLVSFKDASAQQDPQWSQFMYDRISINPGYAGVSGSMCINLLARNQWTGFGQEPKTIMLNGHMPVKILRGGVGVSLYNDELGFLTNNIARLSYAYHTGLGSGMLGIGMAVGVLHSAFNPEWEFVDEDDERIEAILNGASDVGLDLSLGAYYQSNQFYIGISATHIPQSELEDVQVETARHYYLMGGYQLPFKSDFLIRPNALIKTDLVSTQYDLNCTVLFKNKFWVGASYRVQDAIAPMLGFQTVLGPGLGKIGYAYDYTTSNLGSVSTGSHEILLNYCFNPPKSYHETRSINPLFLE